MAINKNCLLKLKEIGLPMQIEVVKNKQVLANATIHDDGTVYCSTNGITYNCPSLLRDKFIGSNLGTYKHLRRVEDKETLHEKGVRPANITIL